MDVDVEIDNTPIGMQFANIPTYNYSSLSDFNMSDVNNDGNIDIILVWFIIIQFI